MMTIKTKCILATLVGVVIGWIRWMQPWTFVHELGHLIVGGGGFFIDPAHVVVRYSGVHVSLAGCAFHLVVFMVIGAILVKRSKFVIGWFFYGSAFPAIFDLFFLSDYEEIQELVYYIGIFDVAWITITLFFYFIILTGMAQYTTLYGEKKKAKRKMKKMPLRKQLKIE
jgi:hypothetical protein